MTAADGASSAATDRNTDRARLARVFGEVLPEVTRDERDPDGPDSSDEWLRAQRPPHHG